MNKCDSLACYYNQTINLQQIETIEFRFKVLK